MAGDGGRRERADHIRGRTSLSTYTKDSGAIILDGHDATSLIVAVITSIHSLVLIFKNVQISYWQEREFLLRVSFLEIYNESVCGMQCTVVVLCVWRAVCCVLYAHMH